jgi:hypothetical protein
MAALLAHESREYAAPSDSPIPEVISTENAYNDFEVSTTQRGGMKLTFLSLCLIGFGAIPGKIGS